MVRYRIAPPVGMWQKTDTSAQIRQFYPYVLAVGLFLIARRILS